MLTDDALQTRLFELWSSPPDSNADPLAAFGAVYTDPVLINGQPMALTDLVARAHALHEAFSDHQIEIVDRIAQPGKLAIAFRHTARHTGPWATAVGEIAPTGVTVTGLGIDLLTLRTTASRRSGCWPTSFSASRRSARSRVEAGRAHSPRSSARRILPLAVFGSWPAKSTMRGYL